MQGIFRRFLTNCIENEGVHSVKYTPMMISSLRNQGEHSQYKKEITQIICETKILLFLCSLTSVDNVTFDLVPNTLHLLF